MTQDNYKNNRERVIHLVEAGGATKQSLCEACGFNEKSLASVFAQLRLMGKYNIKDENGVYSLVDEATWNEHRASSSKVQPKTPKEAYDAAVKREQRAATAQMNAEKRFNADNSRENELRKIIADAELELASILVGKAEEALQAANEPPADVPADVPADASPYDFSL